VTLQKFDGIFDVLEWKSLRIPKNIEDSFQGKIQFPGEFKWI
jgi:hypothetical protein